jgi:hypothetical protein
MRKKKMNLTKVRSPEWRARAAVRTAKKLFGFTRHAHFKAPLLIAGFQRSGTTMLMNVLHLHPDTEVFDEARDSPSFVDFRIRSTGAVRQAIDASRYRFPCFKIIADSHLLSVILREIPDSAVIWMYREPGPNAASRLAKFRRPTAAIRAVCDGQPGGGWFAEGVSAVLDRASFSEWDYACLAWWARNRLFFDLNLADEPRVRLLRYESLVSEPERTMRSVYEWAGMKWSGPSVRFVHARSAAKPDLPVLDSQVASRCRELLHRLDDANGRQWQARQLHQPRDVLTLGHLLVDQESARTL